MTNLVVMTDTVNGGKGVVKLWPIGTQYKTRGKAPKLCTVTDILKTYNNAGELVKIRYVAQHEFCGQVVTDYYVVATTIARGHIEQPEHN
mgnify:CR=1 FL=1